MYRYILYFILQYQQLFPALEEICFHCCSSSDKEDYPDVFSVAVGACVPLTPPISHRRILLTADLGTRDPLGWRSTYGQLVWDISDPSQSYLVV